MFAIKLRNTTFVVIHTDDGFYDGIGVNASDIGIN